MALEVGSLIYNRYRIEEIIAQGGMGAIYRATDESLGVQVAVKENLFTNDDSTRQFRREATILAGLRHPNLPRVTDHFVLPEQGQYLVMDYIEGEDLRQRIHRLGSVPEEETIMIGIAICDALSFLHNRPAPIVHRDIKPGNIKITPTGQVFLVDFGLAKEAQVGQTTTIGAQSLTPGYASPEQYGRGTDARSDIYSLGATLYAALTGKIPEDALARAMGSAELTPIRRHKPGITAQTADVLEKALAVAPEQRYQTAGELKQALLDLSPKTRDQKGPNEEIRVTPYPTPNSSTRFTGAATVAGRQFTPPPPTSGAAAKPRLRPAIIGGIIALVLGLGGVCLYLTLGQTIVPTLSGLSSALQETPQDTPPQSVLASPTLESTETLPVATATLTPTPALPTPTYTPRPTPTGGEPGQIAFASSRSGVPQIWLMDPDGNDLQQITDLADGACQPEWSPDGERIVFTSPCKGKREFYNGSGLFIINADGSGLTPIPSLPGGDFDPAWSPNGSRLAFTSLREGIPHIFIYDLEQKTTTRLSSASSNDRKPVWSPDGKWLAFESTRLNNLQIWVMESSGETTPREFISLDGGISYMAAWSPDGNVIVFSQGSNLPWLAARQFNDRNAVVVKISDIRPVWDASYSQDGFWLAFEGRQDGNNDIYRMTSLSGGNLTRLTDDPADDFQPAWRPRILPMQ